MRRSIDAWLFFVLVAVASIQPLEAATITDGNWWSILTQEQKVTAVQAFINGISNGWWLGFTTYDTKIEVAMGHELMSKSGHSDDKMRFDNEVAKAYQDQKSQAPAFTKSITYYIGKINEFYDAYPTAASVEVGTVLHCLSDKPWMPCSKIAKQFASEAQAHTSPSPARTGRP